MNDVSASILFWAVFGGVAWLLSLLKFDNAQGSVVTTGTSSDSEKPAEADRKRVWVTFLVLLCISAAVALCVILVPWFSTAAQTSRLLERAKGYFEAGDYEKAKIEYMNVLGRDSRNTTACQELGTIWFEQGAPLRAFPFLRKAAELAPDNLPVRTTLALAMLQLGSPREARAEANAILAQAPTHDDAIILLAETALTNEEMVETEQRLQQLNGPDRAAVHVALAGLAGRRGDLGTLEKEAQLAVSLDPRSIHAHLSLANSFLAKNDLPKAAETLKAAVTLAPQRSSTRLKLAEIKMITGAVPEAKALLQELTRKAPDYWPAWRLQAQIAFREKKFDESLALLEQVLTQEPANIESRLLQAQVWLSKGDAKQAITHLERLRATYPNLPAVMYQLALAYLQNANPTKARVVLDEALAINLDFTEAVLLQARVELGSGDAQRTVSLMEGLLKKRPTLVQAQLLLAEAYRTLGRLDEAAWVYREQLKASPKNSSAYFMLGMILRQKGALPEAREAFGKAQELAPDDLLPTFQLVDLDVRDKEFKAAHERVAVRLQKNPNLAGAHVLQGRIFAAQGEWDQAEAAFLKSLELEANESSVYNDLIGVYVAAGRLPQAIARLEAHLAKHPDDPRALMTAAAIYERLNEFSKAQDAYERILSKTPESVPVLNNLAYLYAQRMNQVDKGYELALKARTLNSTDPSIADTLGWTLYKRGDYQQALTLLTESAGKLPDSPEVQFHLGMAAYMMGQAEVARTALKLAASAGSEFPGKPDIQVRLALLESGGGPDSAVPTADLEAALQKQPDDILLQIRLAGAYEQQGVAEKAAGAYEKTLELNPKLTSAVIKLAQLHAGPLQKPDKAMEHARKARELAPNDPQVAAVLGAITYQAGDYPRAYGLLQEGATGLPDDPGVLHDLAWAAYSQGKVEEARKSMQHLKQVAPAAPQLADAISFLELTALDPGTKDIGASASKVETLLEKDPGHVPALMARAALLVERGEAKAAADLYSKVLVRFPDFAPAQKWLATVYATDPENIQKGYGLAVKARKVLPGDPDLAQTLAGLAYQLKEFSHAAQLLQESARKRPLDAMGLYYLGRSLLATKEIREGKAALERSLAAGLQEPLAADVKSVLSELPKQE